VDAATALKFILKSLRPFKRYLAGILFVLLLAAVDGNLRPYLVKRLIDATTNLTSDSVTVLLSVYALSQLVVIGGWIFSDWCVVRFYAPLRVHLTAELREKIRVYPYSFFQNVLSGKIVSKMNDVFNLVPSLLFFTLYQFLYFILTAVFSLYLLARVNGLLALALLCAISLFLFLSLRGVSRVAPLSPLYAEAKAGIWGYVGDYISNIWNVKCFGGEPTEAQLFQRAGQEFTHISQKLGYFLMGFYGSMGGVTLLYTGGILGGLIYLHKLGTLTPGDFALVFMLNIRTLDKLYELSHHMRSVVTDWGTLRHALHMLDIPPGVQDAPHARQFLPKTGEIIFEEVRFSYPGAEPLFHNKHITIREGEKVGLVGHSGSGKTSFVSLILRLFDVDSGRILIDGQDVRQVTQDSLRAAISVIQQDPGLFHRTLMENIRYGRPGASDQDVFEAARQANADTFISALPKGYATLVGERGIKLSGGQRQRIAIARAFLKQAPLLILDEATSQMDALTEQNILQSLLPIMATRTTLVIAHRLSTLIHMDRILVFNQGHIVQQGSHTELLGQKGLYRELWKAQIQGATSGLSIQAEPPLQEI